MENTQTATKTPKLKLDFKDSKYATGRRKQLTKLKIYTGSDHPHSAQNPQVIELGKLNSKNLVRN